MQFLNYIIEFLGMILNFGQYKGDFQHLFGLIGDLFESWFSKDE